MKASLKATLITIPATVPLASRLLRNRAGVLTVACVVGLLLIIGLKVWLVLLGVERTGVEISFALDPVL